MLKDFMLFFGKKANKTTELIISLIKFRISRAGQAAGMSKADAEAKAEETIRQQNVGA